MESDYPLLLDTFINDSETRLGELRNATHAGALALAAHSFKGSSSNMGALQLAELCHELEERAKRPPLLDIEELINRIDGEFATVRRLYRDERQRFPC
ncbi:MAG: Hpt domain-containing protein [Pseudomonas sp.]|uniref:Hpt domain-containing protein n=1 Tax=Pseudomonas abieticivorans TaxID=2931382 RepID=UPI0020BEDAFC|nr:Hpt domain-containing protein [Pseudomonas sp. PIA16]MDE1164300.1 Hpt domain-containing protein [Pseudomonas sp.]